MFKEIILLLSISLGYSQCDTNDDGQLNINDVVIQINCILDDCWEIEVEEDVVHYDDYVYETIVINDVHWMAENLRATHYNNGDDIVNIEWDDGWTYNYEPACVIIMRVRLILLFMVSCTISMQ